jgi:hypothetical protein
MRLYAWRQLFFFSKQAKNLKAGNQWANKSFEGSVKDGDAKTGQDLFHEKRLYSF